MFAKIEKEKIAQLILLFNKYIKCQNIKNIEVLIGNCTFDAGYSIFSKDIPHAGLQARKMIGGKLSIKEAGKVLVKLKQLQKRKSLNLILN